MITRSILRLRRILSNRTLDLMHSSRMGSSMSEDTREDTLVAFHFSFQDLTLFAEREFIYDCYDDVETLAQ